MVGAVVGSIAIWALPELLRSVDLPGQADINEYRFLIFGALLVVMMIFRPQGVFPSRRRAREIGLAGIGAGGADALAAPGGVLQWPRRRSNRSTPSRASTIPSYRCRGSRCGSAA